MSHVAIKCCDAELNGARQKKKGKHMAHSIKNQIFYSISQNWHEGTQKRNYKMQQGSHMTPMVFSHSECFRLKDIARDLGNFLKNNHPGIKQVKDITPNMIQDFLNSKSHCSRQTINTYYQSLKKIDLLLEKTYKSYDCKFVDLIKPISTQGKNFSSFRGVENQIPTSELTKILDYCKQHPGQSSYAIQLQTMLGIRVNELVHGIKISNIDFDNNTLSIINTKGGKPLEKNLSPDTSNLLKEIISQKYDNKNERLFTIENASVNRYLSRIESTLGINGKYSTHNIRSRVAQDFFDTLRAQGYSKHDALKETSLFLNHRTEREQMLTQSYIHIH